MSGPERPRGDVLLVGRATRRLALQVAGLVALAMLMLVSLVTLVVVRGQSEAGNAELRTALATADDVVDPPPGAWLVLSRGGVTSSSPGLPSSLDPALAELRATSTGAVALRDLPGAQGRDYRVGTQVRDGEPVQVVLDLTSDHRQRSRLLQAMAGASLLALVFSVALGVLLGRRAVRPLADALTLQRAFVADASHELRTPLTLLSTRAQLLDRAVQSSSLDPSVLGDSRGVVHDVQRLGEVVDDLLVAADPGGTSVQQPTDVAPLVRGVVDSAGAHAVAAGVVLDCETGDGPARVLGSAPALRRAVLSLVDNAIDHTPAGGQVHVRTITGLRTVTISVSDTGPGVPAGDVFARFRSGGQRAGRAHYGLGLALCSDVASRHGGLLRIAPAHAGATFELVLPGLSPAPGPRRRGWTGGRPRKAQESPSMMTESGSPAP